MGYDRTRNATATGFCQGVGNIWGSASVTATGVATGTGTGTGTGTAKGSVTGSVRVSPVLPPTGRVGEVRVRWGRRGG